MDIQELFGTVQAAYAAFKAKEAEKDAAGAAYHAATKEYEAALADLNTHRAALNDILGNVASDPRIRMSA